MSTYSHSAGYVLVCTSLRTNPDQARVHTTDVYWALTKETLAASRLDASVINRLFVNQIIMNPLDFFNAWVAELSRFQLIKPTQTNTGINRDIQHCFLSVFQQFNSFVIKVTHKAFIMNYRSQMCQALKCNLCTIVLFNFATMPA